MPSTVLDHDTKAGYHLCPHGRMLLLKETKQNTDICNAVTETSGVHDRKYKGSHDKPRAKSSTKAYGMTSQGLIFF